MPPFFVLLLDPANTGGLARRCCTSILNLQDKLLFRNILKHCDEELPGLGDGSDVHALVR